MKKLSKNIFVYTLFIVVFSFVVQESYASASQSESDDSNLSYSSTESDSYVIDKKNAFDYFLFKTNIFQEEDLPSIERFKSNYSYALYDKNLPENLKRENMNYIFHDYAHFLHAHNPDFDFDSFSEFSYYFICQYEYNKQIDTNILFDSRFSHYLNFTPFQRYVMKDFRKNYTPENGHYYPGKFIKKVLSGYLKNYESNPRGFLWAVEYIKNIPYLIRSSDGTLYEKDDICDSIKILHMNNDMHNASGNIEVTTLDFMVLSEYIFQNGKDFEYSERDNEIITSIILSFISQNMDLYLHNIENNIKHTENIDIITSLLNYSTFVMKQNTFETDLKFFYLEYLFYFWDDLNSNQKTELANLCIEYGENNLSKLDPSISIKYLTSHLYLHYNKKTIPEEYISHLNIILDRHYHSTYKEITDPKNKLEVLMVFLDFIVNSESGITSAPNKIIDRIFNLISADIKENSNSTSKKTNTNKKNNKRKRGARNNKKNISQISYEEKRKLMQQQYFHSRLSQLHDIHSKANQILDSNIFIKANKAVNHGTLVLDEEEEIVQKYIFEINEAIGEINNFFDMAQKISSEVIDTESTTLLRNIYQDILSLSGLIDQKLGQLQKMMNKAYRIRHLKGWDVEKRHLKDLEDNYIGSENHDKKFLHQPKIKIKTRPDVPSSYIEEGLNLAIRDETHAETQDEPGGILSWSSHNPAEEIFETNETTNGYPSKSPMVLRALNHCHTINDICTTFGHGGNVECINPQYSLYSLRINDQYRVTFTYNSEERGFRNVGVVDYHRK
jgi:plasmid maintenance system killer protein